MIRVLVVDDSRTVREALVARLQGAGLRVVGEAADGQTAVRMTRELRPDVVLMDVVMSGIDGLAATRLIMSDTPTPVVVLSGYTTHDETLRTYDALAAGALEVCAKPVAASGNTEPEWNAIVRTIEAAAQACVMRFPSLRNAEPAGWVQQGPVDLPEKERQAVVIGASTGGPAAIKRTLEGLPADFPLPIIVAIHCSRRLTASVAGWFDRECALHVRDAQHSARVPDGPGVVLTVPPGCDLRIRRGRTMLEAVNGSRSCSPSVDALFTSAADAWGDGLVGVLLTGMGNDGALGLARIHDCGGVTIAQDENSCVVFGMPKAGIEIGAAEHIVPLREISSLLNRLAGVSPARGRPGG